MTGCASDKLLKYGRSVACGVVCKGAAMLGIMSIEIGSKFPSLVLIEICAVSILLFKGVLEPNEERCMSSL